MPGHESVHVALSKIWGDGPKISVPVSLVLIGLSVIEGGAVLLNGMAADDMSVVVVGALVLMGAAVGLLFVNRKSDI